MQTVRMPITPDQADSWLKTNSENYRTVSWPKIDSYVRAMNAGEWLCTHQGISFDESGKLSDGQHRLYAIVISKQTVEMMVTFNQPRINEIVFDEQRPRDFDTHAKYNGSKYRHAALAVARILEFGVNGHYPPLQTYEMFAIIDKYDAAIIFALNGCLSRGYVPAPVMAVIAKAWYYGHHDRLKEFIEVVHTGKNAKPGADDAALVLRTLVFIQRERDRSVLYNKTQSALIGFLKYTPMTKLYGFTADRFPIKVDVYGKVVAA
jgi:hypothetical protein